MVRIFLCAFFISAGVAGGDWAQLQWHALWPELTFSPFLILIGVVFGVDEATSRLEEALHRLTSRRHRTVDRTTGDSPDITRQ